MFKVRFLLLVFLFVLPIFYLFIDKDFALTSLPYFAVAILLVTNFLILSYKDFTFYFFSPSSIMINYVLISFTFGPIWLLNGWYPDYRSLYDSYRSLELVQVANSYFMFCISVTLLALVATKHSLSPLASASRFATPLSVKDKYRTVFCLLLSSVVFVLFSQFEFSIPGYTSSNLSFLIEIACAVIILVTLIQTRNVFRYLAIIVFFLFFVIFEYENKRIAAFLLVTCLMLELQHYRVVAWNWRILLFGLGGGVVFVIGILSMSIMRGYGGFEITSPLDTLLVLPEYVTSDYFLHAIAENLELITSYFHSTRAVNHLLIHGNLALGETFLNALYVFIPRSFLPTKPLSLIEAYTRIYAPDFAARGGSYVPNLYAEYIWNFGYVGALITLFFSFFGLNHLYLQYITRVRRKVGFVSLYILVGSGVYYYMLMLIRGSGWDLFTVNLIFFVVPVVGIYLLGLVFVRRLGTNNTSSPSEEMQKLNVSANLITGTGE